MVYQTLQKEPAESLADEVLPYVRAVISRFKCFPDLFKLAVAAWRKCAFVDQRMSYHSGATSSAILSISMVTTCRSSVCLPMRLWQEELSRLMYLYMLWTWLTVALMLEEMVSISIAMEFRRLSSAEKRSPVRFS